MRERLPGYQIGCDGENAGPREEDEARKSWPGRLSAANLG